MNALNVTGLQEDSDDVEKQPRLVLIYTPENTFFL